MIDLQKLRQYASEANTGEMWYTQGDLDSCSYSFDKAFIEQVSPSVVVELLDMLEEAMQDKARIDWMDKVGRVNIERVREGHVKGPIRWDVEYGYYDDAAKSKKGLRTAIDAAMQS